MTIPLEEGPSTGYGDEQALLDSTAEVPMGGPQPMVPIEDVPNLSDPSQHPEEPLTAGLMTGPGAGPEALGPMGEVDPVRQALQAMLLVAPNNDIQRLIDMLDIQGR